LDGQEQKQMWAALLELDGGDAGELGGESKVGGVVRVANNKD